MQFTLTNIEDLQVSIDLIDTERGCGRKLGKSNTFFSGDKIFLRASEAKTKFYIVTIR